MANGSERLGAMLGSLSRARLLFRLRSYDTSTEEGRALERNRRATWATTTHVAARALEAGVSLLSIPLTIGYLGKEQYGMWMAISSLLTWAVLADFGLLRGLSNHLSDAYGRDDTREAGEYMSTAFFALLALAAALGAAFTPALWTVPWARLLKIREPALEHEVVPALGATVGVFLAQFPLKVVKQAYGAFQRGHVANLFAIGGSLASLGVLLGVIQLKLGLPWLIMASGGVTVAMSVVNLIYIAHDMPFLWPRPSAVSRAALGALVRVSTPMLMFELGSLLINEVQMVIIARERGVSAVTDYSVYLKVMSVPLFLVNVLDAPYVPMYREARARGDRRWFREMFSRLQWSKLGLSLVLALVGVLWGDWLAGALSGQSVRFGAVTWALAGLTMVVGCWNGSYNNLFFAIGRLWTLVLVILANGVVTLSLTLLLTGPYGMAGVLIASTAFSLLVSGWLLPLLSRDVFREGG